CDVYVDGHRRHRTITGRGGRSLMTGLREMVQNELRRRDNLVGADPFSYIVDDKGDAMTDAGEAVAAIEVRHGTGRPRVTVHPDVAADGVAALEARHPAHFRRPGAHIVVRTIEESGRRFAERPEPAAGSAPSPAERIDEPDRQDRQADAAERAAA